MSVVYRILVIQKPDQDGNKLRELLHSRGYQILYTENVYEIPDLLRQMSEPVLIGFCGKDDYNGDFVRSLSRLKEAHDLPLVLVGKDASAYSAVLERYFRLSATVDAPFDYPRTIEAVANMMNFYASGLAGSSERIGAHLGIRQRIPEPEPETIPKLPRSSALNEKMPEAPIHELYTTYDNIPNLLFDQISSLTKKTFETNQYIMAVKEKTFQSRDYMPKNVYVQSVIQTICKGLGKWGASHLHRTAFLSHKMTEALSLSEELRDHCKIASFLFAESFDGKIELIKRDYLCGDIAAFRIELSDRLKESAIALSAEHEQPEAAKIVETFARLVRRELKADDDPITKAASAVMAADMVDRACWQLDYWNPRTVNLIMHKVRNGEMSDVHPAVLSCIVSFLAQSQSPKQVYLLVPKHLRNNKDLKEFAQNIKEQKLEKSERKVPLSSLQPGMRLTRPVFAFDGEQILSEDIVLDEDLIWRIWELSSVRPINAPLVVQDDAVKEPKSESE